MNHYHKHQIKNWMNPEFEKQHRNGRIWGGIILIGIGSAFLLKSLGYILPYWLFSWPMILILVGIYQLGKHGFKRPFGMVPLAIGSVFLIEKLNPGLGIAHIAWPAIIIAFGLAMIFSPWGKWRKKGMKSYEQPFNAGSQESSENTINIESIFAGVERNIINKDFKGGNITVVFGGAGINLMQADIQGTVVLEVSAVFGGIDLTVPSNWKVQTEISAILGGVQDKRAMNDDALNNDKLLILKGSVVFGGVNIKAY